VDEDEDEKEEEFGHSLSRSCRYPACLHPRARSGMPMMVMTKRGVLIV
jgi:hypothetical protein